MEREEIPQPSARPWRAAQSTFHHKPARTLAKIEQSDDDRDESGLKALLPAVVLALGLFGLLGFGSLMGGGVPGHYVVVAAPGSGVNDALAISISAGGVFVAPGGFTNVFVAASDREDFKSALRQAGAWAVFPAPKFLGCSQEFEVRGEL